ncbi:MAG: hypothetical protein Q8R47_04375 [Nanoarchaeota archaeon]|nr:hypothetical protein [Nanoarchaeota archaeon]
MAKRLKVKKRNGAYADPFKLAKAVLSKAGFTGGQLALATKGAVKEAGKLAHAGVLSSTDLEKAIVKAVANTNNLVMNKTRKISKKVLR